MIEVTTQEVDQLVAWLSSISDGEEEGVTCLLYSPRNQAVRTCRQI